MENSFFDQLPELGEPSSTWDEVKGCSTINFSFQGVRWKIFMIISQREVVNLFSYHDNHLHPVHLQGLFFWIDSIRNQLDFFPGEYYVEKGGKH